MTASNTRALITALTLAAMLLLIAPRGAQAQDPGFAGAAPRPGEQALLVTTRALGPSGLVTGLGAAGCTVQTLAVIEASAWATYVSGAPAFANASFPQTLAAGAPFYVRCAGTDAATFSLFSASGGQSGLAATQVASRGAAHGTYDRFVLEFEGDAVPAYQIDYVDEVFTCGAGDPVALAGSAILHINLPQTFVYDPDSGELTIPSRTVAVGGAELIEAREVCAFEGQAIWALGLQSRQGFRVFELTSPARLVIDIAHP